MMSSLLWKSGCNDEIKTSEPLDARPGGMFVQARTEGNVTDGRDRVIVAPPIRVRVKYGSMYHEVSVNPQASFGELKKLLAGPTGLHHEEQKLIYKKRERSSRQYLDIVGVKDGSKMVMGVDVASHERRCLEKLTMARREKAAKSLAEIDSKVQKVADQVSAMGAKADEGGKVEIKEVDNLTGILMTMLVKLDGMVIGGDQKLMKNKQEKKIQGLVEVLDMLKLPNSMRNDSHHRHPNSANKTVKPVENRQQMKLRMNQTQRHPQAVITTKWETFE